MNDDIFKLQPNLYGIGVDLRALFSHWRYGSESNAKVSIVAKRFLQLFDEHGITPANMPRVLTRLRYSDLASEQSLLAVLTPQLLDEAANLFGVRTSWLAGTDHVIYETDYSYKTPNRLIDKLGHLARDAYNMPLRALATSKNLNKDENRCQRLELVAVEPLTVVDGVNIHRYHAFSDGWDWRYEECRIQLKAMIRAIGRPVPIYQVTDAQLELVYGGSLFYGPVLRGPLLTEPSLEDYAMTAAENVKAKEVEEIPRVQMYVRANYLDAAR